jgi:hypothetical protein
MLYEASLIIRSVADFSMESAGAYIQVSGVLLLSLPWWGNFIANKKPAVVAAGLLPLSGVNIA